MRKLLVLIIIAATLWGGYWFVGSSAVEKGLTVWFEDRQNDGWVAEYSDLGTSGFPNRFDTTITDLQLADPRTGVAWTAPFFQIFTLSYKPNHIIATWPNEQVIASPRERLTITSDKMQGSVVFKPKTALTLDHSSIVLENFAIASDQGWKTALTGGSLHTKQTTGVTNSHDIAFQASGVTPSTQFLSLLDQSGLLPDDIELLTIDSSIGFDGPWDRFAIEQARPNITSINLKHVQAKWGDLDLRIAGKLDINSAGVPEGALTIKAQNWREILHLMVNAGLIPPNLSRTVEVALEFIAASSGKTDYLDADLTFQNGRMSFGPIPLGAAPRLVIR